MCSIHRDGHAYSIYVVNVSKVTFLLFKYSVLYIYRRDLTIMFLYPQIKSTFSVCFLG